MPYSSFTLSDIKQSFGISTKVAKLFNDILPQTPSQFLLNAIEMSHLFTLNSEKEKSEAIIFPIMAELKSKNKQKISIFSGRRLDVDIEKGLVGECDFIISNQPELFEIESPIISVIGAKKDDISLGIGQCIAQMIGSRIFNEKKGSSVEVLYGCVTTADDWLFLKLEKDLVSIDSEKYYLNQIPEILGIFQMILDQYK